VLNGAYYSLPYDVLNDFAPISPLVTNPVLLFARKTLPASNLTELIAWLKLNPNRASVGRAALPFHLVAALFQKETGTQFCHYPLSGRRPRNPGPAGRPDRSCDLKSGQAAIGTGRKYQGVCGDKRHTDRRSAGRSDLRRDGLPAISYSDWTGLFAPKGTPTAVVGKLNAAATQALADPIVRSRLADLGFEFFPRDKETPEALAAMQKADARKWWPIIKEFGIKAE
jgi:tripartite-type tricarboxylate transporter receptor subunit TctC